MCAHKSFSVVTFSGVVGGKKETGKWGNVVFVQIQTAEVYFPTQRYISRPQRCIFKLRPLVISHTTLAPATFTVGFIGTGSKQENRDENENRNLPGKRALVSS